MSLKDTWTPQTETMDAIPDIPNMLADAIIQNETDIVKAQKTADSANKTAAAVSGQLADMNIAIQGNTNDILNTNINVSQLAERVDQNETDIKELQESGGVSPNEDDFYSLAYYGDINIKPSDSSLFEFTTDDTTMTASVKAKSTKAISGDIVIPYEYVKDGKAYSVTSIGSNAFYACLELLSVIIPKGVTTIGYQSFPECYKLASITIPDSVITIDEGAFTWDDCLTSITLPESIISIGKHAFLDCKNLSNIYFKGTKEQWDAIDIGGTNNSLETANIHYDWSEGNDSSGEQEIVYANVSTTDGVLTSDKTFDEMYEAVQSGKTVVTIYGAERFTLTKIEPAILWFSSSFSTGDWNGKMRTLMCIKNSDADVWGDHEINLAGTAYVDNAVQEATPVKGVDYWTEEDKAEIKTYVDDAILGGAW